VLGRGQEHLATWASAVVNRSPVAALRTVAMRTRQDGMPLLLCYGKNRDRHSGSGSWLIDVFYVFLSAIESLHGMSSSAHHALRSQQRSQTACRYGSRVTLI